MTDPVTDKAAQKKKRDIALASVLMVVFLFLFIQNILLKKKPGAPPASGAVAAAPAQETLSDKLVFVTNLRVNDTLRQEQEKVWEKEWVRDPFVPQASISAIVRAVNLTLNGILWDETRPKAIVNEKTLLIGDTLYGYTVVEIKPRSVILRTGEKNIELHVFHPVVAES